MIKPNTFLVFGLIYCAAMIGQAAYYVGKQPTLHSPGYTYPPSLVLTMAGVVLLPLLLGYLAGRDAGRRT